MPQALDQTPAPLNLPAADGFAAWLDERCAAGLQAARDAADRLKAGEATTPDQALRIWDEGMIGMSNAASVGSLFSEVHPDEAVRSRGEAAVQDVQKLGTELQLDRELYDVFAALDAAALDPQGARLLDKTLTDFRRAGVDRDDATRARITEINEQMTVIGQEFSKNIRDGKGTIRVAPERLDGLPQDWLDEHPAEERRPGHRHHRLPRRHPGAHLLQGPRRTPRDGRRLPQPGLPAERAAPGRAVRAAVRSSPGWSATTPGPTTTPA